MKKTTIYILILALVIAGLCPAVTGCAANDTALSTQPDVTETSESALATQPFTETFPEIPTQESTEAPVQEPTDSAVQSPADPAPADPTETVLQSPTATAPQEQPAQTVPESTAPAESLVQEQLPAVNTAQDVSGILTDVLAKLAYNVPEPVFGTLVGEWTVLCLARGEYFAQSDAYFAGYYSRIVQTVAQKAASVNQNGALHRAKSTENSRLIVALSAIGKDATDVGGWNLITPYDNFNWILKQGINGPIWALIALDTANYQTQDPTIRQQCIDHILQKQLSDGGWALTGKVSDPDITAMTLQALFPYRAQSAVKVAAEKGFACLSALQKENGGYVTFGDENSESCAQVIVACATWGINPDTDSRFIKNGTSVLDSLLAHYVDSDDGFKHIQAGTVDAMATDQGCYALIAYQRLLTGKRPLYVMDDVVR
jgi:hypothetical protein